MTPQNAPSNKGSGRVAWIVSVIVVLGACAVAVSWLRADYSRRKTAAMQMTVIYREIAVMVSRSAPRPLTIEDVLNHAAASADRDSKVCSELDGRDPWGSPYRVEVVPEDSFPEEGRFRIAIRSFGRNRRDDFGKFDDMTIGGVESVSRSHRSFDQ